MMRTLALTLLFLVSCRTALATSWEYNGSTFTLEANGSSRIFLYENPRSGLPARAGTVIFQGRRSGQAYSGTAYVFSQLCGTIGYLVTGAVGGDDRSVTLQGNVPVRNARCKVTGYENNVLVFNLLEPAKVTPDEGNSNKIRMTFGKDASTFHYEYNGRTIYVDVTAEAGTDHDWFLYEDLVKADPRLKLEIVFGRMAGVENAFATIYRGTVANLAGRRLIVTDPGWLGGHNHSPMRFMVFTHEVGHHICGHRGAYENDVARNWAQELEADQISGVALRTWVNWGYGSFQDVIASAYRLYSDNVGGTKSHPPQAQRIAAITEGYRGGTSPCLGRDVSLPTDMTAEQKLQIERESKQHFRRMAALNGADARWSFRHWSLGEISLRSSIDDNTMRMVIDRPNPKLESAGAQQGSVFFEGTFEGNKVEGNLFHYVVGCPPIPFKVIDASLIPTSLILVARPPREVSNCAILSYHNSTAHVFNSQR